MTPRVAFGATPLKGATPRAGGAGPSVSLVCTASYIASFFSGERSVQSGTASRAMHRAVCASSPGASQAR